MTCATWDEYLAGVERDRLSGELTEYQARTVVGTWRRATEAVPGVRHPTAGRTEDGSVYISWWYGHRNLTLEIYRDGVEWMFCDCESIDKYDGTGEELEREVSEKFFEHLKEMHGAGDQ